LSHPKKFPMHRSTLVIGVDGGGTKTVAWLAPLEDEINTVVLGRGQAGPGNPRAAGFEVAQANIAAAIEAAFADAKLPRTTAAAACFGLAGAGREIEQQRIASWADAHGIARVVRVTGDAEPILAAAAPGNCGIALICGTGSLAWGRNRAGQVARCGGWGYLLGDEGSGYAIARAGLVAAVRAADGRGQQTALLDRLQQELGAASPQDLIERVYSPRMTREGLSDLAKVVFAAAEIDNVAQSIVATAAEDLAEMVGALCRRLNLTKTSYPLALTGSVILNQRLLRSRLVALLDHRGCPPQHIQTVDQPVRGAIALARLATKES
jgi:N-acetylglucosamine kinase-like BadF-type ATPase